jgi:hypothetical protein
MKSPQLMLREELERDRLEMAAELAHRGPTQASKARASAGWSSRSGFAMVLAMVSGKIYRKTLYLMVKTMVSG